MNRNELEIHDGRQAAVLLMTIIQNEGGTFQLTNDGNNFNCDLDIVRDSKGKDPMMIMRRCLVCVPKFLNFCALSAC